MAVITISRQYGSGGDEIARLLCERTGYTLFDKRILTKAAREAGLSDQEIIDYAEDNHKVKNFFDRLLGRSHPVAEVHLWREDADGVRVVDEVKLSEEHAINLVKEAIKTAHQAGNMVIVGRGGQVILEDRPGVLHVRIEAPLEDRILRVRNDPEIAPLSYGASHEGRRIAQDLIQTKDAASADYLKRFYNVSWDDPALYHVILNTGMLSIEQSVQMLFAMAQTIDRVPEFS
ncbi:MAG: AAA family ATPase [Chloroflexota bacterium]